MRTLSRCRGANNNNNYYNIFLVPKLTRRCAKTITARSMYNNIYLYVLYNINVYNNIYIWVLPYIQCTYTQQYIQRSITHFLVIHPLYTYTYIICTYVYIYYIVVICKWIRVYMYRMAVFLSSPTKLFSTVRVICVRPCGLYNIASVSPINATTRTATDAARVINNKLYYIIITIIIVIVIKYYYGDYIIIIIVIVV